MTHALRFVLNGKKAALPEVRSAVAHVRELGHEVDVRVTWEAGDAGRFAAEAVREGVDRIVAGGGDGTVNEVVNGILNETPSPASAMAAVPLGSANDFATGCGVPIGDPIAALELAATGDVTPIDVGKANDMWFLNAIILGFGAEVTLKTPERLKKLIGGAAYGVTGVLTALQPTTYEGRVVEPDGTIVEGTMVFAAISNGALAGGVRLAPRASLTDGQLQMLSVPGFKVEDLRTVAADLKQLGKGETTHVVYKALPGCEIHALQPVPLAIDGELTTESHLRVSVFPGALPFVLP